MGVRGSAGLLLVALCDVALGNHLSQFLNRQPVSDLLPQQQGTRVQNAEETIELPPNVAPGSVLVSAGPGGSVLVDQTGRIQGRPSGASGDISVPVLSGGGLGGRISVVSPGGGIVDVDRPGGASFVLPSGSVLGGSGPRLGGSAGPIPVFADGRGAISLNGGAPRFLHPVVGAPQAPVVVVENRQPLPPPKVLLVEQHLPAVEQAVYPPPLPVRRRLVGSGSRAYRGGGGRRSGGSYAAESVPHGVRRVYEQAVRVPATRTGKSLGLTRACRGQSDGYRGHSADCSWYHQCSNGIDYLMPCPEGLWWHQAYLRCTYPSQADCGQIK